MSIVSNSNHWMFISSNGGLTAGRKNAQYAIFPYYTDDKITESSEITGSKTILRIEKGDFSTIWEPFSYRNEGKFNTTRNVYKSPYGNKIVFEEINHDLKLTFRYKWCSSNLYGFVREATLENHGEASIAVRVVDGIQNIVPYGVPSDTQNRASNLVDAYKRTELVAEVGLGIYALSAIIVDKAEPSEALKANIVWSLGMPEATYLLSSLQLDDFRNGKKVQQETDIKGEKGAYFLCSNIAVAAHTQHKWTVVANVNQDHSDIVALIESLKDTHTIRNRLYEDIAVGTQKLIQLTASSDALQCTSDTLRDRRHFSNTLFNIMRGGIFDDNYKIERGDFEKYLFKANRSVFAAQRKTVAELPEVFSLHELMQVASRLSDSDFERLAIEYLPLKFSRRHGDPSRPWNVFSINTHSEEDGSKILDYEGNWRDIFQNWEALAYAYPEFIDGMVLKFFNASTFDGYNPYRVTKDGFDWEIIEPDDPWSYIGYWGDHQIIYSLKFLEFVQKHYPERLKSYFDREIFVYANVPYKIKSYKEILQNPKDTIDFDLETDKNIRKERAGFGADAALLKQQNGAIHRVNFLEKILASVLAKIANFIPEAGIWMNTQRPEWNDANNALVGNGVSMVTLCYLRRYFNFLEELLATLEERKIMLSKELLEFYQGVYKTLQDNEKLVKRRISDQDRKLILDGLGNVASRYRSKIYKSGFSGKKQRLSLQHLKAFIKIGLAFLEHTIAANKRNDHLYHSYNLMTLSKDGGVSISYLSEMLEGQVAVLSSGVLDGKEALAVLDGLKSSVLFREDQYSYVLYPNKNLPGFLEKNTIPKIAVNDSRLLSEWIALGDSKIVETDLNGHYHFNGNFKNANDLSAAMEQLKQEGQTIRDTERQAVLDVFEKVFDHKAFTGRSGTFFGYEGLGSIYWHMVSKLVLAVQECCLKAIAQGESAETTGKLMEHYYEINEGIGVHKSPELYGAFPTDPYSHTPAGKGAQQPGMTGQVKEDILSRFGELGVQVSNGQITFAPYLLRKEEFLTEKKVFQYVTMDAEPKELALEPNSLGFTYCQVPIIYTLDNVNRVEVLHKDASRTVFEGNTLNKNISQNIFRRNGEIVQVNVSVI
ncbi:MAG: hypothetical protein AAGF96_19380 [Bacteroidota bacterium]